MNEQLTIILIQTLMGTINAIRLYSEGHPQVITFFDKLESVVSDCVLLTGDYALDRIEDNWVVAGMPVFVPGTLGAQLARLFEHHRISRLGFRAGVNRQELIALVKGLSSPELDRLVASGGVYFGHLMGVQLSQDGQSQNPTALWQDLRQVYRKVQSRTSLSAAEGYELAGAFLQTFLTSASPLMHLADIKNEDEYTYVHTINVAVLTMSLANRLGITGKPLRDVTFAALMHDAGKMLIPDAILNKPGKLDEQELKVMRSHPVLGAQFLAQQSHMPKLAVIAALEHHIRYDGGGYPLVAQGWRPHLICQLISVADIYDALRSRRPYREPMAHAEIVQVLKSESGKALNPELVSHFIDILAC